MFKENTIVGYLDSGDTGYLAFRLAGYTAGQISGKINWYYMMHPRLKCRKTFLALLCFVIEIQRSKLGLH